MVDHPSTKDKTDPPVSGLSSEDYRPPVVPPVSSPLWLTWDLAHDAWLEARRARSVATARAYADDYRLFFEWAHVQPWQVTPGLAIGYARHLRKLGRAPATVNRRLTSLHSFYDFIRLRYLNAGAYPDEGRDGGPQPQSLWPLDRINPFDAVEHQRVSAYGRASYPSTDELRRLLACIDTTRLLGKRDYALILTIASTCLRSSAVLSLCWGALEPRDDDGYNLTYHEKGGRQRRAVLPAQAFQCICDYLRADDRPPEVMHAHDSVFVAVYPDRAAHLNGHRSDPGAPVSNSTVNRLLKKYARRAGVDPHKAHVHGLRHAGARLRVEQARAAGQRIDLLELMHVLGHSSIAITQIYADTVADQPHDPGAAAAAAALHPATRTDSRVRPPNRRGRPPRPPAEP